MYTIQLDEVKVDRKFLLVCDKHDVFRSFVIFFDVLFDLPNSWRFSNSPQAHPTHWLQTVCGLDPEDEFEVWKGTTISGRIKMHRIPAFPRSWMIQIDYVVHLKKRDTISRSNIFYMI